MLRRSFFKAIAGVLAAPYIGLAMRPLAERWVPNVWLGRTTDWADPRNWTLGHPPTATDTVVINGGECVIPHDICLATLRIRKGTIRMEGHSVNYWGTIDSVIVGPGKDIKIGTVGEPLLPVDV